MLDIMQLSEVERKKRRLISRRKSYYKNREKCLVTSKRWGRNNRNKTQIYSRRSNLKTRLLVLSKYSNDCLECMCCKENNIEFLTIDHINNNGKEHREQLTKTPGYRGLTSIYRWLRDNNFPKGFRVLCMNCNWVLALHGYCPHNNKEQHNELLEFIKTIKK